MTAGLKSASIEHPLTGEEVIEQVFAGRSLEYLPVEENHVWYETGTVIQLYRGSLLLVRNPDSPSNLVQEISGLVTAFSGQHRLKEIRYSFYAPPSQYEEVAALFVDVPDPEEWIGPEYRQVLDQLRDASRHIPAEKVVRLLSYNKEDPEEPKPKLVSLQAMARFLVDHEEVEDPLVGLDLYGTMHVEWYVTDTGLLVIAFVESEEAHEVEEVHVVAHYDHDEHLSQRMTVTEALEEFRSLVPIRPTPALQPLT